MRFKIIFAWYDIWIGFFWDAKQRYLYFFPVPCCGIRVRLPRRVMMHCMACFKKSCVWDTRKTCPKCKYMAVYFEENDDG